MKLKKSVAKAMADISLKMAKKSCGAASGFGSYEPKAPKAPKALKKIVR